MKIIANLGRLLAALSIALVLATPAHATLQARDLNNDTVTDAFYDTALNITWLRNANVNGAMTWGDANTWANGYSFGGFDDWRLPTMTDTGTVGCNFSFNGTDCGYNSDTATSEMASLFFDTLGNKAYYNTSGASQTGYGLTKTGDFLNLKSNVYWSGLESATSAGYAWYFVTLMGEQNALTKHYQFYALAVRPGDVRAATVPEPESLVLALTALAGLGLIRRRRAIGSSAL